MIGPSNTLTENSSIPKKQVTCEEFDWKKKIEEPEVITPMHTLIHIAIIKYGVVWELSRKLKFPPYTYNTPNQGIIKVVSPITRFQKIKEHNMWSWVLPN